jgi:3-deoxy-D-manno-octulosonic-acid transferase
VVVVNARISDRSMAAVLAAAQVVAADSEPADGGLAQSELDAERLRALGLRSGSGLGERAI